MNTVSGCAGTGIPAVEIKELKKSYGSNAALKGISFEVPQGEIVAFLGPNGAGKTTAINILTGLIRQDSGEIRYNGIVFNPATRDHKKRVGVVPQHNNLDRDLTVEKNLKVHGLLFGMRGKELTLKIDEVLDTAGLADKKKERVDELSGGMKRRLVITRALLHDPSILFLDEPSTGLDPLSRRAVYHLVRKLNQVKNISVVLTTHYIEEAESLASRVILIDRGRIAAAGTPEELKNLVGAYAVEYDQDGEAKFIYFNSRRQGFDYMAKIPATSRIREVNLEDAYIKITGAGLSARGG